MARSWAVGSSPQLLLHVATWGLGEKKTTFKIKEGGIPRRNGVAITPYIVYKTVVK